MRWFNDFKISIVQNQIAYLINAEMKYTVRGEPDKAHAFAVLKKEKEAVLNKLLGLDDEVDEDDKED
jgi:hypothetical protein